MNTIQYNTFHNGYKQAATYSNTSHKGSNKYDVLQTGAIIEMIKANSNYDVVSYSEGKVRKTTRQGQQVHLVRMRDTRISPIVGRDDIAPEIVFLNAYDTTKSAKLFVGFLRGACMNGVIAGTALESFASRHINFDYDAMLGFINRIPDLVTHGMDQVKSLQSKTLSDAAFKQLALEVYKLKLGVAQDKDISRAEEVVETEVNRLLRNRRQADAGSDAWTRLNIVQENILRGRRGGYGTLRAVNSIDKQVKINRFLWDRTLELAA